MASEPLADRASMTGHLRRIAGRAIDGLATASTVRQGAGTIFDQGLYSLTSS